MIALIILKAFIACLFAVGVVGASIIVAAFIIQGARILWHEVVVWYRKHATDRSLRGVRRAG